MVYLKYFLILILGFGLTLLFSLCRITQSIILALPIQCLISFIWGYGLFKLWKKDAFISTIPFFLIMIFVFFKHNEHTFLLINETCFFITFFLLGYYASSIKTKQSLTITLFALLVYGFEAKYIVPQKIINRDALIQHKNIAIDNLSIKLMDTNRNEILFSNLIKNKVCLIDFSYSKCGACHKKYSYLNDLAIKYKNINDVIIFRIIVGSIDDYTKYKKYANEYSNGELKILYDTNGKLDSLMNINNQGYPVEHLIDKNGITQYALLGFPNDFKFSYFSYTSKKIEEYRK